MILRLSLELPEERAHVAVARRVSRCLLESFRVQEQDIDDLEFVVGELASNAVRHAEDHRYRVEVEFHAERVVVTVVDTGKGFSFRDVPAPGTLRSDELGEPGDVRLGGWGLPLVRMLSDKVQFFRTDPEGTTVQAEKALHYQTAAAASNAARMDAAPT